MFTGLVAYELRNDGPGDSPCWGLAGDVASQIDLTAPLRDGIVGYDPSVNLAIAVSESPLQNRYCQWEGHPSDITFTGSDLDTWASITGKHPTSGLVKLSDVIADHLLLGADPKGNDFAKPLTAGFNRGLKIHLGGEIWSHTISDWNDQLALPVMQVEAESLAQIYREQGETQYRLALGGLHKKYNFYGPVKGLIQWLFPSGRDDLPLMDELTPQTVKTETWPSTGAITSGQDNTWSVVSGSVTVSPAGTLAAATGSTDCQGLIGYTFGGSDRTAQFTTAVTTPGGVGGNGVYSRCDAAIANGYLMYNQGGQFASYKKVSGSYTNLSGFTATIVANDVLLQSIIGSTLLIKQNGTQRDSRTDTAISTGTRSATYQYSNRIGTYTMGIKTVVFDDLISSGGSVIVPIWQFFQGM